MQDTSRKGEGGPWRNLSLAGSDKTGQDFQEQPLKDSRN